MGRGPLVIGANGEFMFLELEEAPAIPPVPEWGDVSNVCFPTIKEDGWVLKLQEVEERPEPVWCSSCDAIWMDNTESKCTCGFDCGWRWSLGWVRGNPENPRPSNEQ